MEKWKKLAAGALALALLSGCGRTAVQPTPDASADQAPAVSAPVERAPAEVVPTLSPEEEAARAAAVKAAGEKLESYRWPEEIEKKTIGDREVEFVLHHGNGWTIQVPADWERPDISSWRAPSQNAGFGVSKWDYPVNNPKIYRAQMGSWRHETGYPAPFDYYYDDDGSYNPPEGDADCIYFFAPAGENSYEFTLSTVVGLTTDEERAIQEAMLLSFTQDESSRTLYGEDYQPGASEWDFAMAGVLAEGEKLWGNWVENGWSNDVDGKTTPEYVSYAMALGEFEPGEFVQFGYDERPEGMEEEWPDMLTLYLSNSKLWLYFYKDSPWASVDLAGEKWWTKVSHPVDPKKNPYDVALAWLKAEREWAGEKPESFFRELPPYYSFLSGAGGWCTELLLNADGSFTGNYHDSDMGDMGEDYPNGTAYYCNFRGKLALPAQEDELVYVTTVEELAYGPKGVESVEDGVRFITAGPYGLENAGEVRIYLPGYPVENIPEDDRFWLRSVPGFLNLSLEELAGELLPCWVIHNVDEGLIFCSSLLLTE